MGHRIVDELRRELGDDDDRGDKRSARKARRRDRDDYDTTGVPPPPPGVPPPAPPAPPPPGVSAPPPWGAQQWPPPATSIPMPAQATFQNVQMPQVQLPGAYGTRPPEFAPTQPVPQSLPSPPQSRPSLPQSLPPQANVPFAMGQQPLTQPVLPVPAGKATGQQPLPPPSQPAASGKATGQQPLPQPAARTLDPRLSAPIAQGSISYQNRMKLQQSREKAGLPVNYDAAGYRR